ncbi:MAG TPA: polysaccharide biosynthesis/export family protein [Longimicrobiaceae bacterium]|nr:polysaccharide biosynthesis/export family protein [Longimicrobiaceae bacterium]
MIRLFRLLRGLALFVPLLAFGVAAQAQTGVGRSASQAHMTRQELQEALTRYEQLTQTAQQNGEMRALARYEATLIRTRLAEGDFQVGDRIVMAVAGEPALTDTFVVRRDRTLDLPALGEVSLQGVLRSELQDHLAQHVGRHIRNPVVRASSMMRVSILGAVGRPGFYMLPSDEVLTNALMVAGGPAQTATLTRIRIERGSERIWDGAALQQAIIEGRTLDQLNLRAGDKIVVPERTPLLRSEYIYAVSLLVSLGFTFYGIIF